MALRDPLLLLLLLLGVTIAGAASFRREDPEEKLHTRCERMGDCTRTSLSDTQDVELGRLPETLWPHHQNIDLRADVYQPSPPFPLEGSSEVWIDCLEPTDAIYLSCSQLDIDPDSIEIAVAEDSPIQPDPPQWISFELDDAVQFFIVYLDEPLVTGARYRLKFDFSGTLRTPAQSGFYYDFYQKDGSTRYVAATQFQSYYTRFAFPCFDEPVFKTTYNVTLQRHPDMIALSNMPIIDTQAVDEDWVADTFDITPIMSSYLLCFVIHDFVYVDTTSSNGHYIRVWAREDIIHAADFPIGIVGDMQDWFEEYTGVAYSLPKMDHIALPSKGGAMENWGLITYGEQELLWDPDWSTSNRKNRVVLVIAHELAHQWFGNLVTCAWWNHTWLNEGFATFFEDRPKGGVLGWAWNEINMVDRVHVIMTSDERNSSNPVRLEVDSPWQGPSAFSSFTYNKGGAVVKILYQILGEDSFRRGLNRFLTRHAYGPVYTDDLWTALTEQAAEDGITDTDGSPLDFKEKMDPYVDQRGAPLVTINREDGGIAHAYQTYFLNPPDQEVNDPSPWGETWNIPLTFATEDEPEWNTDTRVWLDRANVTITEDIPDSSSQWLVANVEYKGYYLVDYDTAGREALVQQLVNDPQVISPENRAGFIYDTFRLVRAGYYNEVVGFETTLHLAADNDFSPWVTADRQMAFSVGLLTRYGSTYDLLQSYIRGLVDPVYDVVGWDPDVDEPYEDAYIRVTVLKLACAYDNADCIDQSVEQYNEWKDDINSNPIATDHRSTVYCSAIRVGGDEDFDHAHSAYLLAVDSSHMYANTEKNTLLAAMACTEDDEILQKYLDMTFDPELIRANDAQRALTDIASSDYGGREFMWQYLNANWRDPDVFPDGVSKNTIFRNTVASFTSDEDLSQLNAFIETYPPENPQEELTYEETLAIAQSNNAWAQINQEELDDWLSEHAPTATSKVYPTRPTRSRPGHNFLSKMMALEDEDAHPLVLH